VKPHRRKRLSIIIFIALSLSVAIGLGAYALRQNINLFYTPTQVAQGEVAVGQHFRIGGMVRMGSLVSAPDSLKVSFAATDYASDVTIHYDGILPDLFREGQSVVAEGAVDAAGVFTATRVRAKHDENYMSAEVKAAMEAAGASSENHSSLAEQ